MTKKVLDTSSIKKEAEHLLRGNKLHQARDIYIKICNANSVDFDSWITLCSINVKLGLFKEAEKCCKKVLSTQPNHYKAWRTLGYTLYLQRKFPDAITCYEHAIRILPNSEEAYFLLGNAYGESGNLMAAINCYRKAIDIKQDYVEAITNLGGALRRIGKFDAANEVLNRALQIRPNAVHVLCNLAVLFVEINKVEEALKVALKAAEIDPNFFHAHQYLGSIYTQLGNVDKALQSYQSALRLKPGSESTSAAIARIFEERRENERAIGIIKPLILRKTQDPHILAIYSRMAEFTGDHDNSIRLIEERLQAGRLEKRDEIDLHYELGKRYDAMCEYDLAFKHYSIANEEERALNSDYISKHPDHMLSAKLPAWTQHCDSAFWKGLSQSTNISQKPIFIIGLPRSGTSLIEQILASHPSVWGAGELRGVWQITRTLNLVPLTRRDYPEIHENITTKQLDQLAINYLDMMSKLSSKAEKVVDKMPQNYLSLDIISRLFPKAHVIHVTREPLDNCLSIYFQQLSATVVYSTDLVEIGKNYLGYKKLMEYWKEVLEVNLIEIRYEELVSNFEEIATKMVENCGLEWSDKCLDFYNTRRDVKTPSYYQVRQPIYTRSVNRWKHYDKYLDQLKKILNP